MGARVVDGPRYYGRAFCAIAFRRYYYEQQDGDVEKHGERHLKKDAEIRYCSSELQNRFNSNESTSFQICYFHFPFIAFLHLFRMFPRVAGCAMMHPAVQK